jgi:hypothetical protein
MTFSKAAVTAIHQALESAAEQLGLFARVNGHEPRNAPGSRLSLAIWMGPFTPMPKVSGLASTAVKAQFEARCYLPADQAGQSALDGIDPEITGAMAQYFNALSGGFTLGGQVMEVDLLGSYGTPLSGTAGYIEQDGKFFRVMNLIIPIIIDETFGQAP